MSEKEKQISCINTYIWNLENGVHEPICKEGMETDIERRLLDKVGEGESGTNIAYSINIHTLLCVNR